MPKATERHGARIAAREQDFGVREQPRNERQLEGVERMLVDEYLAGDSDAGSRNEPPIRRSPWLEGSGRGQHQPIQVRGASHEFAPGIAQQLIFLEAHTLRRTP